MKKLFSLCLALCVVLSSFVVVHADGLQGSGTAEDPYLISTAEDLTALAGKITSSYSGEGEYWKLTNDIDLGGAEITTIGGKTDIIFKGTFDGNNHIISNFEKSCSASGWHRNGLFGKVGGNGVIKNLGVEDAALATQTWYVSGYDPAGGLVAELTDSAVLQNCYTKNVQFLFKKGGRFNIGGGMVGTLTSANAKVENCYVIDFNPVNSDYDHTVITWGTLVGSITAGTVENCYADTKLATATGGTITNSYATEGDAGTIVTKSALKTKAPQLGTAFKTAYFCNGGYPMLSWETLAASIAGSGTESDPYLMTSADDLKELAGLSDTTGKYFRVTQDIDMASVAWNEPIGSEDAPFVGIFDGANHTLSNLNISGKSGAKLTGLFGVLGNGAGVYNLGIVSPTITTVDAKNGIMAAKATGTVTIQNCFIRNVTTEAVDHRLGLFVDYLVDATLNFKNCYTASNIPYETKKMHGRFGDFVGNVDSDSGTCKLVAENCYSTQFYFSLNFGLNNKYPFTSDLKNVYTNNDGSLHYWHNDLGNDSNTSSSWLGTKKTTDELKTLTESLGGAFVPGTAVNDGYPQLAWERGFDVITSAQKSGNQITVTINKGNADQGTLFAAAYSGDTMVRAAIGTQKVTASGTYTVDLSVGDSETAKVFLILDDGSQFTPLSMKASID